MSHMTPLRVLRVYLLKILIKRNEKCYWLYLRVDSLLTFVPLLGPDTSLLFLLRSSNLHSDGGTPLLISTHKRVVVDDYTFWVSFVITNLCHIPTLRDRQLKNTVLFVTWTRMRTSVTAFTLESETRGFVCEKIVRHGKLEPHPSGGLSTNRHSLGHRPNDTQKNKNKGSSRFLLLSSRLKEPVYDYVLSYSLWKTNFYRGLMVYVKTSSTLLVSNKFYSPRPVSYSVERGKWSMMKR